MKENAEQRSVGVHEDLGIDPLLRGANQLNQKNPKPDDAPSKSSWRFDYVVAIQQEEWVPPERSEVR
jgi:hypothetical protein